MYGRDGCDGGDSGQAFAWWKTNFPILEGDYTYTARYGACEYDNKPHTDVVVSSYHTITANSPD